MILQGGGDLGFSFTSAVKSVGKTVAKTAVAPVKVTARVAKSTVPTSFTPGGLFNSAINIATAPSRVVIGTTRATASNLKTPLKVAAGIVAPPTLLFTTSKGRSISSSVGRGIASGAKSVGRGIVGVVKSAGGGGGSDEAPPCGFFQRVHMFFGGRPVCTIPPKLAAVADPGGYGAILAGMPEGPEDYATAWQNSMRVNRGEYDIAGLGFSFGSVVKGVAKIAKPGLKVAAAVGVPGAAQASLVLSALPGGGKKKAPPPCRFVQRVSRVFGGRPACS